MKDTFFKSTFILLIGGLITKILGMVIKIVMTRIVGLDSISLYMLIFPTFALFMTISQFGLPTALSKLIAESSHNNKKIVLSIIPISLLYNFILMILIFIIAPIISKFLFDERTLIPIISISFVLPFDSLSSILRGYFFGKEKMFPHILSLICEQIVRLSLIVFIIPMFINKGIVVVVSLLILVNVVSEFSSIIVLLLFIKDKKIRKKDLLIDKNCVKSVFSIAIPTTGSRLIQSISYFFEPIVITTFLNINGYSNNFIVREYGLIEGYVLPLLLMPSFLMNALSSALIPDIAKKYVKKDLNSIKKRINQVLLISVVIGLITSSLLYFKASFFLNALYGSTLGVNYLKTLSFFFIILYIEYPLESILQAISESKTVMINNVLSTIFKLCLIIVLSFLKIGLYNLIIAIICNMFFLSFLHLKKVKKLLYS
ncbi:MAG: oligosaccharide flippase family protein [Bacilli bacterium]|nr:oligosaccharide flippase family protein [Bacilli bacterium]